MSQTLLIVGFVVLLICAHFYDEWTWRMRPREKLVETVRAADWRLHPKAMAELRRRREDLGAFLPGFLPLLAAASRTQRVATESIIRKYYPQVAQELQDYSPIADVETCREKVVPLLDRYRGPDEA